MKIGWIGTGVMGSYMCKHMMTKGYAMQCFNRTASKADDCVKAGAVFTSPIEMAKNVDVMILMLGYPEDVETMCLGKEGIVQHMKAGSYLIDHTTSSPGLAVKVSEEAEKRQVHCIDAPVSGGDVGAKNGCLVTMIGGHEEHVQAC